MNNTLSKTLTILALLTAATGAQADPLPGRDVLKFSQRPMINRPIADTSGLVQTYQGHDELSTVYGYGDFLHPVQNYQGRFMADDFADNFNSPVVHVKWWGSYRNDHIESNMAVNRFLISFESDKPAGAGQTFSSPDQPLLNQTVTRALTLTPGSGTYTEKLIRGPDPLLHESLFEYNAELHINKPFPEQAGTVYWLKIAAVVDVPINYPSFDFHNPQNGFFAHPTVWGWHNRDYTIQDPLASAAVSPGEFIAGSAGLAPVWHFQDDAVTGDLTINPLTSGGLVMPTISQSNMSPTNYLDLADGPGPHIGAIAGIGSFSKDLAFEIYTVAVPEPASAGLLCAALVGLATRRRRASASLA
jgi:hypothetical protein